uniref:Uncharacterized protein n=1 Tax=Helianthus annuus TaxID=4232 RepID=A0A251UZ68_HELAN
MGDYDRIFVREALGGGAGMPKTLIMLIQPLYVLSFHHSSIHNHWIFSFNFNSFINKDKEESVVSSFFSVRRTSQPLLLMRIERVTFYDKF